MIIPTTLIEFNQWLVGDEGWCFTIPGFFSVRKTCLNLRFSFDWLQLNTKQTHWLNNQTINVYGEWKCRRNGEQSDHKRSIIIR